MMNVLFNIGLFAELPSVFVSLIVMTLVERRILFPLVRSACFAQEPRKPKF